MAKLSPQQSAMADEIKAVLEKYGYKQTSYLISQGGSTSRLTINLNNPGVTQETKFVDDYKAYAGLYGFKPEWLNTTFVYNREEVTLLGFYLKGRREPQVAFKSSRGTRIAPVEGVLAILSARKVA